MKRIILTATDLNPPYDKTIQVFLKSLFQNSPEQNILIGSVKSVENQIKEMIRINKFQYSQESYSISNPTKYRRNYIRHYMINKALKKGYDQICWMDNDVIVRSDINEIWDDVEPNSFKIIYRPEKRDKYKLQTGIYVLGNSEPTKIYISNIIKGLLNSDKWILPQLLMWSCYENLKKEINLVKMRLLTMPYF